MRMHTPRTHRGFERFTFADGQTANCNLVKETGTPVDTEGNAGPAMYDYSTIGVAYNGGLGDDEYILEGQDPATEASYVQDWRNGAASREFTWDLIDGFNMGKDDGSNYVGGNGLGNMNFGAVSWDDCEYVIIKDLQWEIELLPARPQNAFLHNVAVDEDDNDADLDDYVHFPRNTSWNRLSDLMDDYFNGLDEVADLNDVWNEMIEVIRAPFTVSLLRLPVTYGQDEATEDMYAWQTASTQQLANPGDIVNLAPLGYLRYKELDEPANEAENWSVSEDLLGTTRANMGANMYHRTYRPWQSYDNLRGVILARRTYAPKYWLSSTRLVQEHYKVEGDDLEILEPLGSPAFPTNTIARNPVIRGGFRGEIKVSARDPRPLVLTLGTCPIKLPGPRVTAGTSIPLYTRHTATMVRHRITANIKVR